jgi:hypothetical protein
MIDPTDLFFIVLASLAGLCGLAVLVAFVALALACRQPQPRPTLFFVPIIRGSPVGKVPISGRSITHGLRRREPLSREDCRRQDRIYRGIIRRMR